MNFTGVDVTKTVFRVRGLPNEVKSRTDAANLVSRMLCLSAPNDVIVFSLATTLDYWEKPPSRVATLRLRVPPSAFGTPVRPGEWKLDAANEVRLTIDTHFLGLTPLNDVDESRHDLEYIESSSPVSPC